MNNPGMLFKYLAGEEEKIRNVMRQGPMTCALDGRHYIHLD